MVAGTLPPQRKSTEITTPRPLRRAAIAVHLGIAVRSVDRVFAGDHVSELLYAAVSRGARELGEPPPPHPSTATRFRRTSRKRPPV